MLLKKSLVMIALFALATVSVPVAPALAQAPTNGKVCVFAFSPNLDPNTQARIPVPNALFGTKNPLGLSVGSFLTGADGRGCLDVEPGMAYNVSILPPFIEVDRRFTQMSETVLAGQAAPTLEFKSALRLGAPPIDPNAPGNLCVLVKDDLQRVLANINITVKNSSGVVEGSFQSNAVSPECISLGQGNYTVLADTSPYRIVRPPNPQGAGILGGQTTDVVFSVALRQAAPARVLVTPDLPLGWGITKTNNSISKFVAGPGGQPNGLRAGSVQFETKANPGGKPQLSTPEFNGKQFDSITMLKYSTYIADYADNNATYLTPVLNIGIDLDGNPLTTTDTATLFYEPCHNVGNCMVPIQVKNTWNTWDARASGQKWWSTTAIPNTDFSTAGSSAPLSSLFDRYPEAAITSFSISAGKDTGGAPWNNLKGSVDGLVIAFDNGPETTYDFDFNSPPIVQTLAPDVSGVEGTLITTSGKFSDPDGDPFSGWNVSPNIGTLSTKSSDGAWTWAYTPTDNVTGNVTITASDGHTTVSDSFLYSVANVTPTITVFTVSPLSEPVVNTKVTVKATYTDPGKDTSSWTVIWGDGVETSSSSTDTDGSVNVGGPNAEHFYQVPGPYQIELRVTDKDGGVASQTIEYLVVIDLLPDVHGNGEFESPSGAYPGFAGKAKLGVRADYPKSGITPKGKFNFKLEHTDLDFKSTALDSSVLSYTSLGPLFTLTGVGKIKSVPGYSFLFSSFISPFAGQDKVRVKIWETNNRLNVIYDNAPDGVLQGMPKGDIKIKQ